MTNRKLSDILYNTKSECALCARTHSCSQCAFKATMLNYKHFDKK